MDSYAKCQTEKMALLQHQVRQAQHIPKASEAVESFCSEKACPIMESEAFKQRISDHCIAAMAGDLQAIKNDIAQLGAT